MQYGMGRKLHGKLLGFLSYFSKVMNAVADSETRGIPKNQNDFNRIHSVF